MNKDLEKINNFYLFYTLYYFLFFYFCYNKFLGTIEKMIINTGQRTDIPAFYSKWFINRIKEGYVLVRNPYYPKLVTKFILVPKVVDVIGFCTKNPHPMLEYLDDLSDFRQFWYISITAFGKDLEPNVPHVDKVIEDFKYLSKKLGKNAINWRYTPIIINEKYPVERHIRAFEYIASHLVGYTSLAVFGFVDIYEKLKLNHPEILDTSDENKIYLAREFSKIAKKYNMNLRLCSKEKWLRNFGIDVDGCMRLEDYENAIGLNLKPNKKMQARKNYCSCFLSNDIGAYNSCLHFCKYCYANGNAQFVKNNFLKHDDNSPFIIGTFSKDDIIKEAKQESWIIK